jgi:uncharacterized membrane protein (Fun14 family)
MTSDVSYLLATGAFAAFGFVLGFFLRRGINIVLFAALTFAVFLLLDRLGVPVDWPVFHKLTQAMSDLGKTVIHLVTGMLGESGPFGVGLFLAGAIAGLICTRR